MADAQNKSVAVLLAMYNGEKYILEQLQSLLDQTYHISKVFIGDDGSTDNSFELVDKFIIENNLSGHWFLIRNEKNLGHAGNFINLCKFVQEDYVFFCDQDDIWMNDKVERMVAVMEKNSSINFLYADVINFRRLEDKDIFSSNYFDDGKVEKLVFSSFNYFFKGLGCGSCLRGDFVNKMTQYWTKGWEHDMFYWACAILTDSGYKFNCPVIYRRLHENNASIKDKKTLGKRRRQVELSISRPDCLMKLVKDNSIKDKDKLKFIKGYKKSLLRRQRALTKRNLLILLPLFFGGSQYYLKGVKGLLLDAYLIIFKEYKG